MLKKLVLSAVGLILIVGIVASNPLDAVGVDTSADRQNAPTEISPIVVSANTATPQFPLTLTFDMKADSLAPIVDARVYFSVERESFVKVVTEEKVAFTSSTSIAVSYIWDMRYSGGLPIGTMVNYWWTITDSYGRQFTTGQQKVSFIDSRYNWQIVQQNGITLYWYSGSRSFAQGLLDISIQGLVSLEANTGAGLNQPVSIYIYASSNDMLGAMIFAQDWTGGVAYPSYNTIVIGINSSNLAWGERALVHELTHLANHQMSNNPYNYLPVWLNEGLAMYAEGPLEIGFQQILTSALSRGSLFSVRSMASPFSADANMARQEYAQSYSLVDYLVSHYGSIKMAALLESFRGGNTYDGALMVVYGFDMDGLYQEWLSFATQKYLYSNTVTAK